MQNKNRYLFFFTIAVFAIGIFFVGFWAGQKTKNDNLGSAGNTDDNLNMAIRQSGYNFISPLLECELENKSPILKSTELKIKKIIQEDIIDKNPETNVSIYYRDLMNGPSFEINGKATYSPASLLKVPLLMAYYKYAEEDPGIFGKELAVDNISNVFNQELKSAESVIAGQKYTISQLIELMIRHSDNEATRILFEYMNPEQLREVFNDLGIQMPDIYDSNNSMVIKDYASFFRILYNASYLNSDMSEQALNLLSRVEYKNGLVAGTPKEITVSHKFGEREVKTEDGKMIRQLHDCGIVYEPSRPYLICVMTRGNDFKTLEGIITQVSGIIYKQVSGNLK